MPCAAPGPVWHPAASCRPADLVTDADPAGLPPVKRGYRDRDGAHLMTSTSPRYDDLNALFINCTLKPSPELSHTQGLIEASAGIMAEQGARTEIIRAVDHDIATGVAGHDRAWRRHRRMAGAVSQGAGRRHP